MKTLGIVILGILIMLPVAPAEGVERVLISTDFTGKSPPITTLFGTWSKSKAGLVVGADSRISLKPSAHAMTANGWVVLRFIAPVVVKPSAALMSEDEDCWCALKISLGRCLLEISDRGVSIERMDPTRTFVDSTFKIVNRNYDPPGSETSVAINLHDRVARVTIDDSLVLETVAPEASFTSIEIATYMSRFVITSLQMNSFSHDTLVIDRKNHRVDVAAICHRSNFNAGPGQHNHGFVAWEGGSAADNALFTTSASDSAIEEAIEAIGATPGNNLKQYEFSRLGDPSFPEPDRIASGSPIVVSVEYGGRWFADSAVLRDERGKPFRFRFTGNKSAIAEFRTGCIVCLESCPVGRIGNASYSMRDMAQGTAQFSVRPDVPIVEGDQVIIRISLGAER